MTVPGMLDNRAAVASSLVLVQLAMSPAPTSVAVAVWPKIGTAKSTAAAHASSTLARYLATRPRTTDVVNILEVDNFPSLVILEQGYMSGPSFYSRPSRQFLVPTNAHLLRQASKPLLRNYSLDPFLSAYSSKGA